SLRMTRGSRALVGLLHIVAGQVSRAGGGILGDHGPVLFQRGVALLQQVVHLAGSQGRLLAQFRIVAVAGGQIVSLGGFLVLALTAQRFAQSIRRYLDTAPCISIAATACQYFAVGRNRLLPVSRGLQQVG